MKDEYDFSNTEQGKFYRALEELDIPIYLEAEVKAFFLQRIQKNSLNEMVNSLLKKDIEISNQLMK